jgi:hypothetical protein
MVECRRPSQQRHAHDLAQCSVTHATLKLAHREPAHRSAKTSFDATDVTLLQESSFSDDEIRKLAELRRQGQAKAQSSNLVQVQLLLLALLLMQIVVRKSDYP